MAACSSSSVTPRRSPRLRAARETERLLRERSSSALLTPVRDRLRKHISSASGSASNELSFNLENLNDHIQSSPEFSCGSLSVELVKADMGDNTIKPFLTIARKLKTYDEKIGPYDSVRFIVNEEGSYKLICHDKVLESNSISPPYSTSCVMSTLHQIADKSMVVCPGVNGYSAFRISIGHDIDRVSTENCLKDSVRDRECTIFYKKTSKSKSLVCSKCSSLRWLLVKRKKQHDEMPASQHIKRQSSNSSVSFPALSPHSQEVRVKNMRKTIKDLKLQSSYYSKKIERLALNEHQNKEIGQLVYTIMNTEEGQRSLDEVFLEADSVSGKGMGNALKDVWESDKNDWIQFKNDQEGNVTGRTTNKWSSVTIRLALAIYAKSPSAYHAVKALGILNLPCDKTIKGHMSKDSRSPGINEEALMMRAEEYKTYKDEREQHGFVRPVSEGVLIWDEVKVQSRLIWNSSNSSIVGYAMSSDEFISLHDVYQGLTEDERCQKTSYMLQFLWRDLSSDFDVVGPYFNCSSTMETQFLHSIVVRTMLSFCKCGFYVRSLLCDGASSNLSLLKLLCGYKKGDESDIKEPWFKSPFDGGNVFLLVCPSHQLKNIIAALYSSRVDGTKDFERYGTRFGWAAIEAVYQADLYRAKAGISRRVPGLKYSYIVRDSWTRLNVLPAKIMQQPYMIAAIREMAEKKIELRSISTLTAEYLHACSLLFETGILSHEMITSVSSKPLINMAEGLKWFKKWKDELVDEPDITFRSPLQKKFLAWQTWDLMLIMYHGFFGLCNDFLTRHPNCFISPIRLNGSSVESIFSCLKYIANGNLSSSNYVTSLSSLITQRDIKHNPHSEKGYRTDIGNLN